MHSDALMHGQNVMVQALAAPASPRALAQAPGRRALQCEFLSDVLVQYNVHLRERAFYGRIILHRNREIGEFLDRNRLPVSCERTVRCKPTGFFNCFARLPYCTVPLGGSWVKLG